MCHKLSKTAEALILSPAVSVRVEGSKWERQPFLLLSTHPHTHKQTEIQPHTSEDHKSPSWICNLIAVRNTLELFPTSSMFASLRPQHQWKRSSILLSIHYEELSWNLFFNVSQELLTFFFFTQHRWEQRAVSAVMYLSSWFLSVLCLVGGENLSQTEFLGSFGYKGCLSGQSAGEALRSRWLTWQPPWITRQSPLTAV